MVKDGGVGFDPRNERLIMEGRWRLDSKEKYNSTPGCGVLLIRHLLIDMWSVLRDGSNLGRHSPGKSFPEEAFKIRSSGINQGATATVLIPWLAFSDQQPQ